LRRIGEPGSLKSMSAFVDLYSNVHDPRALASILHKAEADLARMRHPDPYIRELDGQCRYDCLLKQGYSTECSRRYKMVCFLYSSQVLVANTWNRERNIPVRGCSNGGLMCADLKDLA